MNGVSWRFWPLADFGHFGVMVPTKGKQKVAEFLTPKEAKALHERTRRSA